MFEGGAIRSASAAEEKCVAKDDFEWHGGRAWVAQLVERVLGKDEVTGSIPVPGSRIQRGVAQAAAGKIWSSTGRG